MLARFLWALSISLVTSASLTGCGLTLDVDPPDVADGIDGGSVELDAGEPPDGEAPPACTSDADCDDESWCNGEERCEGGVCKPGETPCPDPSACLLRTCDDELDECGQAVSICADDELCTPDGTCVPAPDCATDSDCPDDLDECNGSSVCVADRCVAVAPPVCEGGAGCARSECVPFMGCMPIARHELCDDGATCTENFCAPGAELADADGCVFRPRDALCPPPAGGVSCASSVCVGGPVAADTGGTGCALRLDSSRCPVGQRCELHEGTSGVCSVLPTVDCRVGTDCDDGDPCNGVEMCAADGLCRALLPSCPNDGCQEGWCDRRSGVPMCALRPTAACDSFPAP